MKRKEGIGAAMAFALLLGGCATAPAPPAGTVSSPIPGRPPEPTQTQARADTVSAPAPAGPGTRIGTTASGGAITMTGVSRDGTPSAEALTVLGTIPEPLGAGEGGPVLDSTATANPEGAPPFSDSASGRDSADVPIPAPTLPLGDRPRPALSPDSISAPSSPPPSAPPPSAPSSAPSGPCWRVQVAAPPEAEKAAALRDAAESQLLTPVVIETEKGRRKVRTRDCLDADAAERLKVRAIAAGFKGAFRFSRPR